MQSNALSFQKKNQPRIVLSLLLNFCQISGSCTFKIVLIKNNENTVIFATACIAIGLIFNIYFYAAFKTLLFRYPTKNLHKFKINTITLRLF